MKRVQKWQTCAIVGALFCISLVGCNKTQNEKMTENTPTTPIENNVENETSIYNKEYEAYSNLTDLGVVINQPTEEEIQGIEQKAEYTYQNGSEMMLIIPKYNGSKITVCKVEYNGERYFTKDELYHVDATPEGYGLLLKADRPESKAEIAVNITYPDKNISVQYPIVEKNNSEMDSTNKEYLKVEMEEKQIYEGERIMPETDPATYLKGLNRFDRYEKDVDADGNLETIEIYCEGTVDANGHYLLDDGQEWTLILRKGDAIFPLFERSHIQLGGLKYAVYEDYDEHGVMHMMVTYSTESAIIYYDCTYDAEEGYVYRQRIYEASNINKLNEWSYREIN